MSTPTAYCLIRPQPHYRHEVFLGAFKRLGYCLSNSPTVKHPTDRDVLVIWNRYGTGDHLAKVFTRAGAAVIVVENGYVDMRGTKKAFAMALTHHNGCGTWVGTEEPRGHLLDVEVRPWNSPAGGDILLLPQRGIGPAGVAMPRNWLPEVQKRLAGRKRVRVRPHPGGNKPVVPLEEDLVGVACCVTWGSGAALKAIFAGVPVFHELHGWIGAPAAQFGVARLDSPVFGDREALLERVASAQWTVDEVAGGDPIARLIELHRSGKTAVKTA